MQKEFGCIYCHTSLDTGKRYVGQTTGCPDKRWKEHQKDAKNEAGFTFHRAIRKYGANRFVSRVIENNIPEDQLAEREQHYINLWNTMAPNGYNLREAGPKGKLSEETKKKMSDGRKGENNPFFGKKHSDESKNIMSDLHKGDKNHMFGKKHTEESKLKISKTKTGTKLSKETREKQSNAKKGKKLSMETRQKISNIHKKTYWDKQNRDLEEMGQTEFITERNNAYDEN